MLDNPKFQTAFDPVLNPEVAQPKTGERPRDQGDSFDALFAAIQKKHALARAKAQVEQDSLISPEDKSALLQDLQALEKIFRNELILHLHRSNRRAEIEALIAHPGHPALYFPKAGFYLDRVAGGVHFLD